MPKEKAPKRGSGKLSKIRSKPGKSNAFKYKNVKAFAGPDETFPINTIARGRNALARAHFAKNPEEIKKKVYARYPGLKKRAQERKGKK